MLFYDVADKTLISSLTDYAIEMADQHYSAATLAQECGHLRLFWEFLVENDCSPSEITDGHLKRFRQEQYERTKSKASHRGVDANAKQTTNVKLRRIYHWLHWLVARDHLPSHFLGARGQVRSELGEGLVRGRTGVWKRGLKITCPLLFRVPGGNSKHRLSKFVPTEESVDVLHAHFFAEGNDPFIAHRNCLLIDIANVTGFRRDSVCSLLTAQFDIASLESAKDEFWVSPPRQKFSYINSFPIPLFLAWRIRHFIDGQLGDLIDRIGVGPKVHQGHVFLSSRRGTPLTSRAATQIISSAMQVNGLGQAGSGLHAFRSKFTVEEIERETEYRLHAGLDTSARSIAQAVAMKLGHKNPDSLLVYAIAAQSKLARKERAAGAEDLARVREENIALRQELMRLSAATPDSTKKRAKQPKRR